MFAINQHETDSELQGGRTLARTIELSEQTLVVLDAGEVYRCSALWCLYEIAETPPAKLQLLTHGFDLRSLAAIFKGVDVAAAECWSDTDRAVIHANIVAKHGSLGALTKELSSCWETGSRTILHCSQRRDIPPVLPAGGNNSLVRRCLFSDSISGPASAPDCPGAVPTIARPFLRACQASAASRQEGRLRRALRRQFLYHGSNPVGQVDLKWRQAASECTQKCDETVVPREAGAAGDDAAHSRRRTVAFCSW